MIANSVDTGTKRQIRVRKSELSMLAVVRKLLKLLSRDSGYENTRFCYLRITVLVTEKNVLLLSWKRH